MKILVSLNNTSGSNIFGYRFLKHLANHDVKVMGYYKDSQDIKVMDWVLDPVLSHKKKDYFKYHFGFIKGPYVKERQMDWVIDDVALFGPDLIISYAESISALIGKALNIPVWYCSPIFLFNICRKAFSIFPEREQIPRVDRYFVYAPSFVTSNVRGFEVVEPYVEKLGKTKTEELPAVFDRIVLPENTIITTGEMSYACDALAAGKKIVCSPSFNNIEQMATSYVFDYFEYGRNVKRPQSFPLLKESISELYEYECYKPINKYLHEYLEN